MLSQGFDTSLKIPDLWQQEAIRALQKGKNVVVDAPTGAGKTYIFELLVESGLKRNAVFTVPTRALANDKLAEWRSKGWNVGIATGDLSDNLEAPVIVATLETQKNRLLHGIGPGLFVIDEYQMIGDPSRGLNYELAIALAPLETQLLLLSGSVANADQIITWLRRLGRDAVLVSHRERPVPQEEIFLDGLANRIPESITGFWPRHLARALMADLGPILVFAPRRKASEKLARQLAAALPLDNPLVITREQRRLAGEELTKLLKSRIAFHHSGLSYQQRAGLIEPLAKAGQLRVVVATTGLAAGINFCLRSVAVIDREYRLNDSYQLVRADELLQMFGRAGRRGLDKKGFILTAENKPRLSEARPLQLKRTNQVDWPCLLAVLQESIQSGQSPTKTTYDLTRRLFSEQRIPIGLKEFLAAGGIENSERTPGRGETDREKKQEITELLNSRGEWERKRAPLRTTLGETLIFDRGKWVPALESSRALEKLGRGSVCRLRLCATPRYGRQVPLAIIPEDPKSGELVLTKLMFRLLRDWQRKNKGKARLQRKHWTLEKLESDLIPLLPDLMGGGRLNELTENGSVIRARLDYADTEVFAFVDITGSRLLNPPLKIRRIDDPISIRKALEPINRNQRTSPAQWWFKLGLIDDRAQPTMRGRILSLFYQGEGLAVAAALEDDSYEIDDLIYDLANLRAGHRFSDFEASSGRLGNVSRQTYRGATIEGYLLKGVPIHYGDGAAEVLIEYLRRPESKENLSHDDLRTGDIERAALEWRSTINHISRSPELEYERWQKLVAKAGEVMEALPHRPLASSLPELTPAQRQRYSCQFPHID